MKNPWFYVFLTCVLEVVWVFGFNVANTWWHWIPIVLVIVVDFYLLSKACESLPTGTVYAVFAGAGTVGTVLMDTFIFNSTMTFSKLFFISLVVLGVIFLKLLDNSNESEVVK
ncbi:DMT family transporter [Mammaliicoccus sciuri]|uniref:QacE family quaternary ammonium compound efflux SMR transporter n=1 Tax=Mammaliicoccus sciuri TaxID=1296 RepID=A0AAI8DKJ1_MAMSC|nr:multidrug efflux SMR transporter [Mammaliicoccus sciuri]ASE35712.1 QacE family quaternary ammonium compound efflux SMR transporter [Mammaliicoccus sciuri]MEB7784183.1 multidrug efflux SMR transporter [Mammaliicoccus sciuri]